MNLTEAEYLQKLYDNRFNSQQKQTKLDLWKVLIDNFLQQYIPEDSAVLDRRFRSSSSRCRSNC